MDPDSGLRRLAFLQEGFGQLMFMPAAIQKQSQYQQVIKILPFSVRRLVGQLIHIIALEGLHEGFGHSA
jgi:hypothetical protein